MNRRKFLLSSAASIGGLLLAGRAKDIVQALQPAPLFSNRYQESPLLNARVVSEELPAIDQRLPAVPLTLTPLEGIGTYGGRIRNIGSWLGYPFELQYGHSPLRWVNDGLGIAPGIFDEWSTNTNNTVWTFHLRVGLKWSDGNPCTVDDILFWWQDLVRANFPDALDDLPDFGSAGGLLAQFLKVDDFTLQITYGIPAPLTAKRLANWVNGRIGPRFIAPKHYLSQFHPKYNPEILDFQGIIDHIDAAFNVDLPSLNAWIVKSIVPDQTISFERNPFYYAVDIDGNQLPYVDGVDFTMVFGWENQMNNLLQGDVDFLEFHDLTLANFSDLKGNEAAGNYDTLLWDSGSGTGMAFYWNFDVRDDKLRTLYRNPKFKQAISFAMDRPSIQKLVYLDTGFLTTGTLSPKAIEFNFNIGARERFIKYRDAYVAYDPEKAKDLLNEIGMVPGADTYRTYPDGSPFEFHIALHADAGKECLDVLQIVVENWKAIGLNVIINQVSPEDFLNLWQNGQLGFRTNWEVSDGPDHLVYPSWMVPNETERWAPLCGQLLALEGTSDSETNCGIDPWERNPARYCSTDPQYAGTAVETLHQLYRLASAEQDPMARHELVWQMLDIHYENVFFLGTVANFPRMVLVSKNLKNVPTRDQLPLGGFVNPWIVPSPALTNTETYSYGLSRLLPRDVMSGGPGSIFTIQGSNFLPDSRANITVNGNLLGEVMANTNGQILFALGTSQAEPGRYIIIVTQILPTSAAVVKSSTEGNSIKVVIDILANLPPLPAMTGIEPMEIPPGIAMFQMFLPLNNK